MHLEHMAEHNHAFETIVSMASSGLRASAVD